MMDLRQDILLPEVRARCPQAERNLSQCCPSMSRQLSLTVEAEARGLCIEISTADCTFACRMAECQFEGRFKFAPGTRHIRSTDSVPLPGQSPEQCIRNEYTSHYCRYLDTHVGYGKPVLRSSNAHFLRPSRFCLSHCKLSKK
jgi:hypothetical protein